MHIYLLILVLTESLHMLNTTSKHIFSTISYLNIAVRKYATNNQISHNLFVVLTK